MFQKVMDVKSITKVALMGCMQFVMFVSFADILYLELVTFITVLFATKFKTREVVLASVTFAVMNMAIRQGVTVWSMMYLLIFPTYSLIISILPKKLKMNMIFIVVICGIFSFLVGQLIQIPFILLSPNLTFVYILVGLQTSLIQGIISMLATAILFPPTSKALQRIQ